MGDRDRRDLILEYRNEHGFSEEILSNIEGYRYVFGSKYPGAREGEEFFECRDERFPINPTHCIINVDEQGQFCIQNDTTYAERRATRSSVYTTFVNSERIQGVEKRLLKVGDIISLGIPESATLWLGHGKCPVYRVKERRILGSSSGPEIEDVDNQEGLQTVESPFDNNLILSKIMEFLSVDDLTTARLVGCNWKEASKILEKKAAVSFKFGVDYVSAKCSTKVFRFLHEMRGLKIRTLQIQLRRTYRVATSNSYEQNSLFFSPGEPGHKMMDDLRKLLRSPHNFSRLLLHACIKNEPEFGPVHLILQELGEGLMELELYGEHGFLPEILPQLPTMSKLKKFKQNVWLGLIDSEKRRYISYLVPLFAKTLEHFTCSGRSRVELYLEEFLNHEMPNLKGISIEGFLPVQCLSLLLELKNPLISLKLLIDSSEFRSKPGENWLTMLERLLLKNSKSLTHLELFIHHDYKIFDIKFQPCPKLEELELSCIPWSPVRINWVGGGPTLDYSEHFPSLRKLKVSPAWWGDVEDDEAAHFSSFFPGGEVKCETVTDLYINRAIDFIFTPAQKEAERRRHDKIKAMFPNVEKLKFHDLL